MMYVVPSIDISEGKAVKRIKGKKGSGIVLGDPVKIAEEIYNEGYEFVHIVDLDAAEGTGENEKIIALIAKIGFKQLEVGGGIRSYEKAMRLISLGVSSVVISSLPFINPLEFEKVAKNIGNYVMASIDYCEEKVLIKGWKEDAGTVNDTLKFLSQYNLKGVIFTYVCKEGTREGIDENVGKYVSQIKGLKGYAGGIGSFNDLIKLKEKGLDFAIVGMSFYTGVLKGVKNV